MTTAPRTAERTRCALCRKPLTDRLTGVLDRQEWDARASRAADRAHRRGQPLALVLADLDRFKAVNDTYGHLAGDAVLGAVASVLNGMDGGIVGRYGGHAGDEFLILLPGSTRDEALAVARCAQEHIRRLTVTARASRSTTVELTGQAVSMGVACCDGTVPAARASLADLVLDADVALREVKRAGGGRARTADSATAPDAPIRIPLAAFGHAPEGARGAPGGPGAPGAPGELVLSAAGAARLHALLGEALGRTGAPGPVLVTAPVPAPARAAR
ncbi:GGDEF domain-containing protein [Streptomyces armeniacus]|nr:GGDEF domain-containing protein [Streptomyces armeniacus]